MNVEDEKFIEMKYDRRTPRAGKTNIELNQNDIKCDGRFKFHLGRINLVLMFKLIADTEVNPSQWRIQGAMGYKASHLGLKIVNVGKK